MYLNKVIIVGNLTRDPEMKALPSGIKVCNIGVATNRYFKNKEGSRQEAVEYHNVVLFARLAEIAGQYLKKGSQVLIEGRLQTRSWDSQDGQKKYRTEIVAESMQLGSTRSGSATPSQPKDSGKEATKDIPGDTIQYPSEEINPEDIPF
jgi:single-strand DNA-binding protein